MDQGLKVNLGCGKRHLPGWVNVDRSEAVSPDELCDVATDGLGFVDDESVECINARSFLAHVRRDCLPFVMSECWRALCVGGVMFCMVPYAGSTAYYSDPTHMTGFTLSTFRHFTSWGHDRPDADYGWPTRFHMLWHHVEKKEISEAGHVRRGEKENSFLSLWLGKPGEALPPGAGLSGLARQFDKEICGSGIFPNGYAENHGGKWVDQG